MRIAVLILIHNDFSMVKNLILSLEHQKMDIFIHVDKKFVLSEDEKSFLNETCHVLNKQYDITLFGFNMIKATLDLIEFSYEYARNNKFNYGYFMLLSGQDFPILKMDTIYELLNKSYPKNYIDIDECTPGNWVEKSFSKHYVLKNVESKLKKNLFNKVITKIFISTPRWILTNILTHVFGSTKSRLKKIGMLPFGGSQWWILTDIMIKEIRTTTENQKFIKIMNNVFSPDETFFQTILMNSSQKEFLRDNIIEKDLLEKHQNTMTYADFHDENGNPYGHPRILNHNDIDKIKVFISQKNYFFIRKLDSKKSVDLIAYIKEHKE